MCFCFLKHLNFWIYHKISIDHHCTYNRAKQHWPATILPAVKEPAKGNSWFRNFSVLISQVDVWTYLFVAKGKAFFNDGKI